MHIPCLCCGWIPPLGLRLRVFNAGGLHSRCKSSHNASIWQHGCCDRHRRICESLNPFMMISAVFSGYYFIFIPIQRLHSCDVVCSYTLPYTLLLPSPPLFFRLFLTHPSIVFASSKSWTIICLTRAHIIPTIPMHLRFAKLITRVSVHSPERNKARTDKARTNILLQQLPRTRPSRIPHHIPAVVCCGLLLSWTFDSWTPSTYGVQGRSASAVLRQGKVSNNPSDGHWVRTTSHLQRLYFQPPPNLMLTHRLIPYLNLYSMLRLLSEWSPTLSLTSHCIILFMCWVPCNLVSSFPLFICFGGERHKIWRQLNFDIGPVWSLASSRVKVSYRIFRDGEFFKATWSRRRRLY